MQLFCVSRPAQMADRSHTTGTGRAGDQPDGARAPEPFRLSFLCMNEMSALPEPGMTSIPSLGWTRVRMPAASDEARMAMCWSTAALTYASAGEHRTSGLYRRPSLRIGD